MKIDTYINRIKVNKQFSNSTIQSYTRALNKLDSYINKVSLNDRGIEDTEKLTVWDIEQFIWLEKLHWKEARTCNWYLICFRSFLWYAEHCHEKVISPKEIILMKEPKKKIDALTENDAQRLLNYMKSDKTKDELTKTRDYAMVAVLLYTWLRVSELCNIKLSDVQEELQIIWKNNSLRLVYLFQEHITLLRLYLFLREWKHIESEYLFCSHAHNSKGKKLSRNTVEVIVREAGIKAWLTEEVRPHKLRHTFATKLLRRWGNIYYIKELLWHSSVTTTQMYFTATNNDLKKTQQLLNSAQIEEQEYIEEQLEPMPESIIIPDKWLFELIQKQRQQALLKGMYGRGVSSYPGFAGY